MTLYWLAIIITIALIVSTGIIPPTEELTPCETLTAKYHNIDSNNEYIIVSGNGFESVTKENIDVCE